MSQISLCLFCYLVKPTNQGRVPDIANGLNGANPKQLDGPKWISSLCRGLAPKETLELAENHESYCHTVVLFGFRFFEMYMFMLCLQQRLGAKICQPLSNEAPGSPACDSCCSLHRSNRKCSKP